MSVPCIRTTRRLAERVVTSFLGAFWLIANSSGLLALRDQRQGLRAAVYQLSRTLRLCRRLAAMALALQKFSESRFPLLDVVIELPLPLAPFEL